MSIKAVVFDYGGVICFPPSQESEAVLERLTGLTPETLWDLHRKFRGEWDRGVLSGMEYYRNILSGAGVFLDDDSLAKITQADLNGWKRINPDTAQLMVDVKAAGLKLGILSNMPNDFYSWAKDHLQVFSEVQIAVISCVHGIIKPEAGIFKILQEKVDCEYEEIVFFDDAADNVAAARELGIKSFIWDGPEAARKIINI